MSGKKINGHRIPRVGGRNGPLHNNMQTFHRLEHGPCGPYKLKCRHLVTIADLTIKGRPGCVVAAAETYYDAISHAFYHKLIKKEKEFLAYGQDWDMKSLSRVKNKLFIREKEVKDLIRCRLKPTQFYEFKSFIQRQRHRFLDFNDADSSCGARCFQFKIPFAATLYPNGQMGAPLTLAIPIEVQQLQANGQEFTYEVRHEDMEEDTEISYQYDSHLRANNQSVSYY
jgi:hypothetical protein